MPESLTTQLIDYGFQGVLFWYLAFKLVPQIQRERSEAIEAFREEMRLERVSNEQGLKQIIEHCQEEIRLMAGRGSA